MQRAIESAQTSAEITAGPAGSPAPSACDALGTARVDSCASREAAPSDVAAGA